MFSEASQTEWHKPFDFPIGISSFSLLNGEWFLSNNPVLWLPCEVFKYIYICIDVLKIEGLSDWIIKLGKNPANSLSRNYEDKINSEYIESFTSHGHPKIRYLNKTNIMCYYFYWNVYFH